MTYNSAMTSISRLLFLSVLVCSCSEEQNPGGFGGAGGGLNDGQDECAEGSRVEFDPPLGGTNTEYQITVETDFGSAPKKFESPFSCTGTTGIDDVQSNACLGDDDPAYGDIEADEVHPPLIIFETKREGDVESTETITSVWWGNFASDSAVVTVEKAGDEVFSGTVTFLDATCTDSKGDTTYRKAVVKVD